MLVSTKLLWNLASGLAVLGFDAEAVLGRCQLTWTVLEQKQRDDARVPLPVLNQFWDAAVAVSGDASIGVRVGALARIEMFGVLGYVARASATLGDALLKTARYIKLWNEACGLSLLVEGDRALIWYRSLSAEPTRDANSDAILTTLLTLSRELTGRHLVPDEVRFARTVIPNAALYREVFGALAKSSSLQNALVFSPELLTLPITTHDSKLGETLIQQVSQLADALPAGASWSRRVRDLLMVELRGGNPMAENIAAQLGIHPKTLTRRLKDEGTSHRELLDSLRRGLAERYLSAPSLSLTEIAFLLGFSHPSAFNKASNRWFGESPLVFRQRARS